MDEAASADAAVVRAVAAVVVVAKVYVGADRLPRLVRAHEPRVRRQELRHGHVGLYELQEQRSDEDERRVVGTGAEVVGHDDAVLAVQAHALRRVLDDDGAVDVAPEQPQVLREEVVLREPRRVAVDGVLDVRAVGVELVQHRLADGFDRRRPHHNLGVAAQRRQKVAAVRAQDRGGSGVAVGDERLVKVEHDSVHGLAAGDRHGGEQRGRRQRRAGAAVLRRRLRLVVHFDVVGDGGETLHRCQRWAGAGAAELRGALGQGRQGRGRGAAAAYSVHPAAGGGARCGRRSCHCRCAFCWRRQPGLAVRARCRVGAEHR
eukprot:PhM_4_TR5927/c0_g1_i1/m.71600